MNKVQSLEVIPDRSWLVWSWLIIKNRFIAQPKCTWPGARRYLVRVPPLGVLRFLSLSSSDLFSERSSCISSLSGFSTFSSRVAGTCPARAEERPAAESVRSGQYKPHVCHCKCGCYNKPLKTSTWWLSSVLDVELALGRPPWLLLRLAASSEWPLPCCNRERGRTVRWDTDIFFLFSALNNYF